MDTQSVRVERANVVAYLRANGHMEAADSIEAGKHATRKMSKGKAEPSWVAGIQHRIGKETDASLGREIGIDPQQVRAARLRQGIPREYSRAGPNIKSPPRREFPKWSDPIRERVGVETDAALAREADVSRELVRRLRSKMNIPAVDGPEGAGRKPLVRTLTDEQKSWFITETDIEIGRRLGIGYQTVARAREALGLKKVKPPRKKAHTLDAYFHLFGTMTDVAVAKEAGCHPSLTQSYRRKYPELPDSPRKKKNP